MPLAIDIYTETVEEHQQNLTQLSATVRIEIDRQKQTMTLSGTKKADGTGALRTSATFSVTSYPRTMVIYEVVYKHVLVNFSQARNELTVIGSTHPDASSPDAEQRLLFRGICRPTLQKGQ